MRLRVLTSYLTGAVVAWVLFGPIVSLATVHATAPVTATFACLTCPADTYDTTADARCADGNVYPSDAPVVVTAPGTPTVTHAWASLPAGACDVSVLSVGRTTGKRWYAEPLTVIGNGTPTPTPTPPAQQSAVITAPTQGSTHLGTISASAAVTGTTSARIDVLLADGTKVAGQGGAVVNGVLNVVIDISIVPAGSYVLGTRFSTSGPIIGATVPITIGSVVTPTPTPTPTSTPTPTPFPDPTPALQRIEASLGRLEASHIPIIVNPPTASCSFTVVNSASVTIRCQRADFPMAVVGNPVRVVK